MHKIARQEHGSTHQPMQPDADQQGVTFGNEDANDAETVALLDRSLEQQWQLHEQEAGPARPPWYAYPLLAAAVLAVSSAAVVFTTMKEVPAVTLAAWRLQLTTVLLLPGCILQYRALSTELRRACARSVGLLAAAGVSLAFHFGLWVWGLENTSLVHALLLVSSTPLAIALGTWAARKPISYGEQLGAVGGCVGAILLAQGAAESSTSASLAGDLSSFGACVAVIGYLYVGKILRAWMPIFVYACIVTGIAALLLSVAAIVADSSGLLSAGPLGVFGWVASERHWYRVVYLAVGPGIVGHTGFNTVLKYFSPLVVSLAMTLEPLFGTLLGWLVVGYGAPGPFTYAGGAVMLGAMFLTTVAHHKREEKGRLKKNASIALQRMFAGEA